MCVLWVFFFLFSVLQRLLGPRKPDEAPAGQPQLKNTSVAHAGYLQQQRPSSARSYHLVDPNGNENGQKQCAEHHKGKVPRKGNCRFCILFKNRNLIVVKSSKIDDVFHVILFILLTYLIFPQQQSPSKQTNTHRSVIKCNDVIYALELTSSYIVFYCILTPAFNRILCLCCGGDDAAADPAARPLICCTHANVSIFIITTFDCAQCFFFTIYMAFCIYLFVFCN